MVRQICTTAILFAIFVLVLESGPCQASGTDCPTYWTAFGDNCYRFFGQRVNLKQARYNCRSQGNDKKFAYLASIHSQEENDYLAALFKSYTENSEDSNWHAWIGLNDEAEEGNFVWTDGTDVDFSPPWGPGEPGGGTSQQGAVMMHPNHANYGLWHDATVTNTYQYICKLPRY